MKQTSAALTFLMAQYRAIFKRAYIKGIASAVLLTAGLAAGQAQAENDLSSGWNSGDALVTSTTDDTFRKSTESTVGGITINAGHTLTTSGSILSTKDMTASGNLTIESGAILLADKETVGESANQVIYRHNFTSNSGTTNLSGNVGAASFSLSNGTLVLTSGGEGNTNLTAYGSGWNQGYNGSTVLNADDYDRSTADGDLIDMNVTINSGTNVAALDRLTVDNSKITLAGSGSSNSVEAGHTAYLEGSNEIIITDTDITVTGHANGIFSKNGSITDSKITVNDEAKLLITGNADNYTNVLSGSASAKAATYTLTDTEISNSGTVHLDSAVLNLNKGTVLTNSGTMILGRAGEDNVINIDGASITNSGSGYIFALADIVMTDGTIDLKDGFGLAGTDYSSDNTLTTGRADFKATGGSITLGDADLVMLDINLGGDVDVTLTGSESGDWQGNSHIDAAVEGTAGGNFTIQDNATIEMNDGSVLTARIFNLNGGTITMQASGDGSEASKSGSAAIIRGFTNGGTVGSINLNGGAINVVASKAGVIRSENINLAGTAINNQGILTFAGAISNAANTNVNTVSDPATFQMTGGTMSNATGANLYFGVKDVDNKKSTFTIAGGTFTNAGTANVASGSTLALTGTSTATPTITNSSKIAVASGASFTTAGTVTVGGTGTIELANGASGTFAGENVILNGILEVLSGANASVTGKVTFNGDGQSGDGKLVDLKIANKDNFKLETGGSLTIQDVGQTIGLTHTYGESGGTFSGGTGFAGFNSGSAGTLYLDMVGVIKDASGAAITTMTQAEAEQYVGKLKTTLGLTGEDNKTLINLQGITISLGQEVEDALASGDNTISYDQVSDALASGIENDTLVNTAVKVSSEDKVQGSIGQVQAEAGTTTVNVAGDSLKLNGYVSNTDESKNSNVLVQTGSDASTATVAGIKMQAGSTVSAEATGNSYIGAVTVEANDNGLGTFAVAAGSNLSVVSTSTKVSDLTGTETPTLTYADVGSSAAKINTVQATGTLTAKDVYAVNTNVEQDTGAIVADSLTTEKADIKGSVTVAKTIDATVTTTGKEGTGVYNQATTAVVQAEGLKADTATLAGQTTLTTMEATNATFTGGTHTITKSLEVTDALVVTNGATLSSAVEGETSSTLAIDAASGIRVDGNATLAANEINTSGDVYVGADATSESAGATEGAGSLVVNTLSLNNNDLIVDPAFGGKYSFVGVGSFSESGAEVDAGVMDGNAYALQNAILAIGETDEATVADLFAQYINPENQSLGQVGDKVGSIVYVAQQLDIASGNKLVSDSTATVDANGDFDKTKYATDAYIGDNSVLAISVDAASNANAAAVQFASNDAKITASSTGKVVITGDYSSVDSLNLFADAGTAGTGNGTDVEIVGANGLRVETLNGLMYADLTDSVGTLGIEEMHVNQDKVASAYTDASSSVRNSILSYVTGDTQWYNTKAHDINETRIHGARVADVPYHDGKYYSVDGEVETEITDPEVLKDLTFVKVTVDVPADEPAARVPQTEYVVYEKANNRFLTAVREQVETSGAAAESAARMADFAGVAQVALKAGASTYEAISGRMGMGAENTSMTFANNGQGAGIWLTPIYQTSDSDGFEAQGLDYGADIDLYGIALGGDYTLANGVRVGAMFNVGSGEADGQGAGSAVSNDFDYYGFGLYAGYTVGQFSVVGDVSYTAVDNDVEANTNIDKLETSLDSSNLSLGVTGAYAFETAAGIEVTPHVGLRYSYIDIDDYSVQGKTTGVVGDYSADSLSVFSIPVGVTIASEFQAGSWSVKPSFDITLTGNFGDDENEGTFHWTGVENIDSSLNSEIFDNFTYGASLGVAAQSTSGISLGLTVGYTGSSNVDDLGVSANARFTF